MKSEIQKLNLHKQVLKIASVTSLPFQNIVKLPTGEYYGDGFSFRILNEMAHFFNFSYEIVVPSDGEFGKLVNNTYWTGLIGMLVNKSADMAVATISKTVERLRVVDFTVNLYQDTMGILLEKPDGSDNSGALLAPFTAEVWICVIMVTVLMGPILFLFISAHRYFILQNRKIRRKMKKGRFRRWLKKKEIGRLFADCTWFIYASLLKQSSSMTSSYCSVRILMAFWWIASMLITAFYSANLTAFLTLDNINLGHTLETILSSGVKWMYLEGTALDYALHQVDNHTDSDEIQLSLLRKSHLAGIGIKAVNYTEAHRLIHEDYAYVEESNLLNFLLHSSFEDSGGQCKFTLRKLKFFEQSAGFAFPKDSPYAKVFSKYIEILHRSGLIVKWKNEFMPEMSLCSVEKDHQLSQSEQPLYLSEIYTVFFLIIIGAVAGLTALWVECLCKRNKLGIKCSIYRHKKISPNTRIRSIYNPSLSSRRENSVYKTQTYTYH